MEEKFVLDCKTYKKIKPMNPTETDEVIEISKLIKDYSKDDNKNLDLRITSSQV